MKPHNCQCIGQLLLIIVAVLVFAVSAHAVDTTPPIVSITEPANGASYPNNISIPISATAYDNESGINKVQLKIDGQDMGSIPYPGPYAVPWDLWTTFCGTHTITVIAYNNVGLTRTTSISINVYAPDTTPPYLRIDSPIDGDTYYTNQSVPIRATAYDYESDVDSVVLYIDGGNLGPDVEAPWECGWDLWETYEGSHLIQLVAYNGYGLSTTRSVTINVLFPDTTPPIVSIREPVDGGIYPNDVTIWIRVDASDASDIERVDLYLDNRPMGPDSIAPYECPWDLWTTYTGEHTIRVVAYDNAGLSSSASITITTADLTPPTVAITSPVDGDVLTNDQTIQIQADAEDASGVDSVELYIDGQWMGADDKKPWECPWDLSTTYVGDHAITVIAFDAAGNTASESITVSVVGADNTPPLVSITEPVDGGIYPNDVTIWIRVDASDASDIERVDLYLDNRPMGPDSIAPYECPWDLWTTYTGEHTIRVVAYDNAGLSSSASITMTTADLTPPTVAITSPVDGDVLTNDQTIQIQADAEDASGVDSVELYIDGQWMGADDKKPWECPWDLSTTYVGDHAIKVIAFDAAGNTASESITLTVVNGLEPREIVYPKVRLVSPEHMAVLVGTVDCVVEAYDAQSGIDFVEIWVNGGVAVQISEVSLDPQYADLVNPYIVTFPTANGDVPDGGYYVQARAYSNEGLSSVSQTILVSVDNVSIPTAEITEPLDGAYLKGVVGVWVDAYDAGSGVDSVVFYYDDEWCWPDWSEPFGTDWDTGPAADGKHSISARAYDRVGRWAWSNTVNVTIDNEAPTASISRPVEGEILTKTYDIKATASDNVSGVEKVIFIGDGIEFFTDNSDPYTASVATTQVPDGSYRLQAKAVDLAGNYTKSAPVTIYVANNGVDNTPPTVEIIEPVHEAILSGIVPIKVSATDDANGIDSVVFYGGENRAYADSEPDAEGYYGDPWDSRTVPDGTYQLNVFAYDRFDNVGTASLTFHVANGAGYNIYGNAQIGGVKITTSTPDGPLTAISNENGSYSLENLQPGTWAVSASKDDCVFAPASWTVHIIDGSAQNIDFVTPCAFDIDGQDDCFALQYYRNYDHYGDVLGMPIHEVDIALEEFNSDLPFGCSSVQVDPPYCRPSLPMWKLSGEYVPDWGSTYLDCYNSCFSPFSWRWVTRYHEMPGQLGQFRVVFDWVYGFTMGDLAGPFLMLTSSTGNIRYQDRLRIVDPIAHMTPYQNAYDEVQCDPDDDWAFDPDHTGPGLRDVYPFEVTPDDWGMLPSDESWIDGQGFILTKPEHIVTEKWVMKLGSNTFKGDAMLEIREFDSPDPEDYTCADGFGANCGELLSSASVVSGIRITNPPDSKSDEHNIALLDYSMDAPRCYEIHDRAVAYDYEDDGFWDEIFLTGFLTSTERSSVFPQEFGGNVADWWSDRSTWIHYYNEGDVHDRNEWVIWFIMREGRKGNLSSNFWLRGHSLGAMDAVMIGNLLGDNRYVKRITTYGIAAGTPSDALVDLCRHGIPNQHFLASNDMPLTRALTLPFLIASINGTCVDLEIINTSDWYTTGNNPHSRILYQEAAARATGQPHPVR